MANTKSEELAKVRKYRNPQETFKKLQDRNLLQIFKLLAQRKPERRPDINQVVAHPIVQNWIKEAALDTNAYFRGLDEQVRDWSWTKNTNGEWFVDKK